MTWLRRLLRVTRCNRMKNESMEYFTPEKDIGWQNSTAKIDMVWACVKDGQWTADSKSDALFHNWTEKSRKTTKEVDREYKKRL